MAKFFKPSKQLKSRKHASASKQLSHFSGEVIKVDLSLKGIVSNPHGRIAFVPGVMIGESVKVRPLSYTEHILKGEVIEILDPSEQRIKPQCQHFEQCGGCQLQYVPNDLQVEQKSQALKELMAKSLKLPIDDLDQLWQSPIDIAPWHYRRAARLATWFDKKGFSLGFRESKSKNLVDIKQCPILAKPLETIAIAIKPVIANLSITRNATHLQLFDLNEAAVAVLRCTEGLTDHDKSALKAFAEQHDCHLVIERDGGIFEVLRQHSALPDNGQLHYQVDGTEMSFSPKDFIQVNASVNDAMVKQAMTWLAPNDSDTILDLFSGVGNFSLPLAKRANNVIAVEGVEEMVTKIKQNALNNDLPNIEAHHADLSQFDEKHPPKWLKPIDKLLLDPARDGALAVMQTIPKLKPKQILYISCNPVTMVRDLKFLLSAEYQLKKVGIINMFPQTAHVEAMVLLEK